MRDQPIALLRMRPFEPELVRDRDEVLEPQPHGASDPAGDGQGPDDATPPWRQRAEPGRRLTMTGRSCGSNDQYADSRLLLPV